MVERHGSRAVKPRVRRASKPDPRRLAELKREIASGDYETPERLELALRNLLRDLRRVTPPARPK